MLRTFAAIIAGQFSIFIINGLFRLAIAAYLGIEIGLSGISTLPSFTWKIIIVGLSLFYGIIGGLITCAIAKGNYKTEILSLIVIVVATALFDYHYVNTEESMWYFITNTGLIIAGLFLGYRLVLKKDKIAKIVRN